MSYDLEYNTRKPRDQEAKQPLLNQGQTNMKNGSGASPAEIMKHLEIVSRNIGKLIAFSTKLETGKMKDQERTSMNRIMPDTSKSLIKCKELLENYSKSDKETMIRKFNALRSQFEQAMQDIKVRVEQEKIQKMGELDEVKEGKLTFIPYSTSP